MSKEKRRGLLVEGSGPFNERIRSLVESGKITIEEGNLNGVLDKLMPLTSEEEARGKVYLGRANNWRYDFFSNASDKESLCSYCQRKLLTEEMEILERIAQTEGNITVYGLGEELGPFKVMPHETGERCEVYHHITSFYRDSTTKEGEKSK